MHVQMSSLLLLLALYAGQTIAYPASASMENGVNNNVRLVLRDRLTLRGFLSDLDKIVEDVKDKVEDEWKEHVEDPLSKIKITPPKITLPKESR
ncbi:hypothetical protein BDV95DRAFT_608342 [Massariosphaeria phaeospora]|uniref:Uncharacterized protein n=1 Tax=Massariosphaeria phaeospora TaxID=100035 RepID=A0A7C8M4R8_9PLEO|nr:hypothetical protein BDV95DRAFT_608342 [Massariosphaeria phaeospora]